MFDKSVRLWRQYEVCRVVNKYKSDFDINIQRGTIWGNPFTVEEYGDKAIPLYREHLIALIKCGKIKKEHLEVLRGQRLGCTCHPKPCHGDVIAEIVNKFFKDEIGLECIFND